MWSDYWRLIDETYELINEKTRLKYELTDEPTEAEIFKIISEMETKKACYGPMTIDLVKLGGEKIFRVIHRCIVMCVRQNVLPTKLREEKMTLLYKNKGQMDNINDYRGIFLRYIVL